MPDILNPTYEAIVLAQDAIQRTVKLSMASEDYPKLISPWLTMVNQWATQIPVMLREVGPNTSINLVFSIRKDLFLDPHYTHPVFHLPPSELPLEFQEFQDFIRKLIRAQKVEQPVGLASLVSFFQTVVESLANYVVNSQPNVFPALPKASPLFRTMKSP